MALDDKYEDIQKLIDTGKEKGFLTYNEVNDLLPNDINSPDDLDDLLGMIGTQGINVLEDTKLPSEKKFDPDEESEDVELDLTPGALEKTNDPVRMYLREMGTVPLLTREGEVEIAKRIERGQIRVLKALSRSAIVIREVLAIGDDLKRGVRSVKEVVIFDEEEITDEVMLGRLKEIYRQDRRSWNQPLQKGSRHSPPNWPKSGLPAKTRRSRRIIASFTGAWAARR